jgi:hypothetical protein
MRNESAKRHARSHVGLSGKWASCRKVELSAVIFGEGLVGMGSPSEQGANTEEKMWLRPTQIEESGAIFLSHSIRKALLAE